ncbi:uncharacterized protein LOC113873030 [Abrus precatorius]|uniref:Uncharacterized protein LOC113873030 n=1 Tax=Abrus precatorius TaxID=3816 RepID=A0A8B8MGE1_ABRPR|nr:uncharacterized protein LOC113873030 [Abrus precatorius]
MDIKSTKDANGCINKPVAVASLDGRKVEDLANRDDDSDSNSLLPPQRGAMSRKTDKICRKVQWNDKIGNKLVEVLEYEPSDVSDSEDEDSCICSIM